MNGAFEVGKVALQSQQRALETTANNIANVNTPGFKRAEVIFAEVVTGGAPAETMADGFARAERTQAGGVRVDTREAVSRQGELRQTGAMLDIAIDGPGLIELLGPDGRTLLWRGGRLSVNRDGYLAGADDLPLRALVTVADDLTALEIGRDGVVAGLGADGERIELGQITLVRPESDGALERAGPGLFEANADARLLEDSPGEAGMGVIAQGMVEESNVDFSQSMIELLMIQRAYAASAQIVQAADQLSSIANNLKR